MSKGIDIEKARAAKKKAGVLLEELAPGSAVGITRVPGGYAVKVNLRERLPTGVELPREVDGVPLRIEIVGRITKRVPNTTRTPTAAVPKRGLSSRPATSSNRN